MGDTRNEMTPSDKAKDKAAAAATVTDLRKKEGQGVVGAFGRLIPKKKALVETTEKAADTFAEMVELADSKLDIIIAAKQRDFEKEKDDETYNRKALLTLAEARHHLDGLINACVEYAELKH